MLNSTAKWSLSLSTSIHGHVLPRDGMTGTLLTTQLLDPWHFRCCIGPPFSVNVSSHSNRSHSHWIFSLGRGTWLRYEKGTTLRLSTDPGKRVHGLFNQNWKHSNAGMRTCWPRFDRNFGCDSRQKHDLRSGTPAACTGEDVAWLDGENRTLLPGYCLAPRKHLTDSCFWKVNDCVLLVSVVTNASSDTFHHKLFPHPWGIRRARFCRKVSNTCFLQRFRFSFSFMDSRMCFKMNGSQRSNTPLTALGLAVGTTKCVYLWLNAFNSW